MAPGTCHDPTGAGHDHETGSTQRHETGAVDRVGVVRSPIDVVESEGGSRLGAAIDSYPVLIKEEVTRSEAQWKPAQRVDVELYPGVGVFDVQFQVESVIGPAVIQVQVISKAPNIEKRAQTRAGLHTDSE